MVIASTDKIYRSYYTESDSIVAYMTKMLNVSSGMRVLEPCAGEGVFVDALNSQIPNLLLDLYELNPAAFLNLQTKYKDLSNVQVFLSDVLTDESLILYANAGGIYDRIIANPPYGGWQDYDKRKKLKKLYNNFYVKETYSLFLLKCIQLLREDGILVCIIPDTFLNLHRHTVLRKYLLTNTKLKEIVLFPSSFFPKVSFGYANLAIVTLQKSTNQNESLTNLIKVVTGFNQPVQLLDSVNNSTKSYHFTQNTIYTNLNHALYLSESRVTDCLNLSQTKIGDIADCVTGFYSGNDKRFLRKASQGGKNDSKYLPLNKELICADYQARSNLLDGITSEECFVPIVKGGAIKYFKPNNWYMDWSSEAVRGYKVDKKARFQNSGYYFKFGIGIPMVSSSQITASVIENKLFDQSIVGVFSRDSKWIYYLLAFFNSPTCNILIRTINPSANNPANYIKKIPFLIPSQKMLNEVNLLTNEIVEDLQAGRPYKQESETLLHSLFKELYGF